MEPIAFSPSGIKKDVLYQRLRNDILSGKYPESHQFPTEPEMANAFQISRITLRAAMKRLESENLVKRIPGKGTFVCFVPDNREIKRILVVNDGEDSIETTAQYILPGIQKAAEKLGFGLEICLCQYLLSIDEKHLSELKKERNLHGVILMGNFYQGDEPQVRLLKSLDLPVVIPRAHAKDGRVTGFATICSDSRSAWFAALDHLLEQGHRRIACVNSNNTSREITDQEHLDYLARHDAYPGKDFMGRVPFDFDAVKSFLSGIVQGDNPPTAIICYSDFYALHVYRYLMSQKIRIPEDIAVMGFCGFPGGKLLSPPLSTIDVGYFNIGEMAVEMIIRADELFGGDKWVSPPRILSPYQLAARESTRVRRVEHIFSWPSKLEQSEAIN
jgi:DNA-binding LacI/PurR family transcriptional regulator